MVRYSVESENSSDKLPLTTSTMTRHRSYCGEWKLPLSTGNRTSTVEPHGGEDSLNASILCLVKIQLLRKEWSGSQKLAATEDLIRW